MRLRSLLRPRRGLEVGTFLPSGEVTETEGDVRVSNIGWDVSKFVAVVGPLKVREVAWVMEPGEVAVSGPKRRATGCAEYNGTGNLFQTGKSV